MYNFTFGTIKASVGLIEKVNNPKPGAKLFLYKDYSVTTNSGNRYGFKEGYITEEHLQDLTGTEDEKLEQFFEALSLSYEARDTDDEDEANVQLKKLNLGLVRAKTVEKVLEETAKTKKEVEQVI